jgi:hypothetical protein
MRLILGKHRAAISLRRRIEIPCQLLIEPERQAKLPSASLRVDPLKSYVLEVNPVNTTPLSEKGSRFANTKKKAAAQLIFEGAVPSFKSCTNYMNSWTKEVNDTESKATFIQGKKS